MSFKEQPTFQDNLQKELAAMEAWMRRIERRMVFLRQGFDLLKGEHQEKPKVVQIDFLASE